METSPREGVMKEKFPNSRKPAHQWVCREFWNLRGQHNRVGEKKKNPAYTLLKPTAAAAAKSLQSCPTLCDPIDGSPPGSPFLGFSRQEHSEWVAISFSNAWKWKVKVKSLSRVQLFATPWTAAHQAPPSMGFSRQKCWSGVPPYLNPSRLHS